MLTHDVLTPDFLRDFTDYDNHERVVHFRDGQAGLNAFIAVHNSALGPALGGCRMVKYASEKDALRDVLRLSRGMTYKNALAGLPLGGGKSVIIADPFTEKTDALLHAFGRAVDTLAGLYITAEDSGTTERDIGVIRTQTNYALGLHMEGADLGGNPSPSTAWGVYHGMKAAAMRRFGVKSLAGMKVAVQGLGAVGYELSRLIAADGATVYATDIREDVVARARREIGNLIPVVDAEIFSVEAEIFAPCALGAQLNDDTIPMLKAGLVAGAANNQLATPKHGRMLAERNILYVPDYVLNAGGVIAVSYEYLHAAGRNPFGVELNRKNMTAHVERIGQTVTRICNIAEARGITPAEAADELAESIFRGGEGRRDNAA
jgi:leucine dehydrogenase